ncbi:hypothetical protein [Micromonospora ureilytica]|uniref:Uncharacterized protein n=1 Tax=Micromonospora ureilytica TaxID=709868 RepID=A0ABS0JIX8_9ACTN|nr:hypothetical protein [Micromonospora ureilytica]MBG6066416.1 hypothetical protein [Micromonospora ureilytica]
MPIGAGYSLTSNFIVLFDEKSSIVQYTETYISENAAGNFNITSYSDGNSSAARTQMPYMSDAQLQKNSSTDTSHEAQSTRYCVGGGVPFCIACIAAYATIGGASITAIASCFK